MSGEKKNKSDWNFFLPIFIRDIGLSHSHSLSNEMFMKNEEEILFQFFFCFVCILQPDYNANFLRLLIRAATLQLLIAMLSICCMYMSMI